MGIVSQHQLSTFSSPVNGTTPIDANTVRGNDNTVKTAYNAHDADATIHLQNGLVAARPAASTAGQTWLATDTGGVVMTLDTGSAWVDLSYLKLAGGTITGDLILPTAGGNLQVGVDGGPFSATRGARYGVYVGNTVTAATGTYPTDNAAFGIGLRSTMTATANSALLFGISNDTNYSAVGFSNVDIYSGYDAVTLVAGAYTIRAAHGHFVDVPVIGAGAAITNLYGLYVNAQSGATTINRAIHTAGGDHYFGGAAEFVGAVTCDSTLNVVGALTVNTNKFSVVAANGNTTIAGTLDVTSAATFHSSTTQINNFVMSGAGSVFLNDALDVSITASANTSGARAVVAGGLSTAASVTSASGFRIPHGAAPTSPVNGDMWTTTAGLFVRINGVTKTVTLT